MLTLSDLIHLRENNGHAAHYAQEHHGKNLPMSQVPNLKQKKMKVIFSGMFHDDLRYLSIYIFLEDKIMRDEVKRALTRVWTEYQ